MQYFLGKMSQEKQFVVPYMWLWYTIWQCYLKDLLYAKEECKGKRKGVKEGEKITKEYKWFVLFNIVLKATLVAFK